MAKQAAGFGRLSTANLQQFKASKELQVRKIDVSAIKVHESQPRKNIDQKKIEELAQSIKATGMVQPIGVVESSEKDSYFLAYGQRRWLAHKHLGEKKILARVFPAGTGIAELSIIENLFREDLSPIEEAEAIDRLATENGYTNVRLAEVLGMSRQSVGEVRSILKLDAEVLASVRENSSVNKTQLIELVRTKDPKEQRRLWFQVEEDPASVSTAAIKTARKTKVTTAVASSDDQRVIKTLERVLRQMKKTESLENKTATDIKKVTAAINKEIKRLTS